jgi:hypothetical protein
MLSSPQVAFLQDQVRDLFAGRVDHEGINRTETTVRGMPRPGVVAGRQGDPDALLRGDQVGRGKNLDVLGGIELLELLRSTGEADHAVLDACQKIRRD